MCAVAETRGECWLSLCTYRLSQSFAGFRIPPSSSNPCSCMRMHENQVVHHFVRYRCGFCRSSESHGLRPVVDPQGIRRIGIAENKRETTQHGIHQDSVPLPGSQSIRRHVPRCPDRTNVRPITLCANSSEPLFLSVYIIYIFPQKMLEYSPDTSSRT